MSELVAMSDKFTTGAITELFSIQGDFLKTPNANGLKAVLRSNRQSVTLWISNNKVVNTQSYLQHLQSILSYSQIDWVTGGISVDNLAFVAIPALDGNSIAAGKLEIKEAERRILGVIKLIANLHKNNLIHGNLSESSFWISRTGSISLVCPLTGVGLQNLGVGVYVDPACKTSKDLNLASDVYALGVIAYKLMTGIEPESNYKSIANYVDVPPVWVEEVVKTCLSLNREERPANAISILELISASRDRVHHEDLAPAQVERRVTTTRPSNQVMVSSVIRRDRFPKEVKSTDLTKVRRSLQVAFVALGGLVLLALSFFIFGSNLRTSVVEDKMEIPSTGNPELDQGFGLLQEKDLSALRSHLSKLENEADPATHNVLVQMAISADNLEKRKIIEEAIIKRALGKGLVKSSHQVQQWLKSNAKQEIPKGYKEVLNSIDPLVPLDQKSEYLKFLYTLAPRQTLRLATAIAFELGELEKHQTLLSQLIGDNLQIDLAKEHSALALVLAHEELALVFADDIVQQRSKLSDQDILWVLDRLGRRADTNTRAIANLALKRGLLKGTRVVFAEKIRDRNDLPSSVLNALVKCSAGSYDKEVIDAFGRWIDKDAEEILLAICADVSDQDLKTRAFEITAGKNVVSEPAASLITWVRTYDWDNRVKYTNLVGAATYPNLVGVEVVKNIINSMQSELSRSELKEILVNTNSVIILKVLLENYPHLVTLTSKLNLLSHADKAVRIAAVNSIDTNQIGALKIIKDNYESEKDEEVREHYKRFWIINEK